MSPDLDPGVVERPAELDPRLAHPDPDLVDLEVGQELVADRLGQCLEQPEGGRFDDLADRLVDLAVVDRPGQVVIDAGRLEVESQLDVDLERLGGQQLVVVVRRGGPGTACWRE